jgi:hypothetical protein
MLRANAQPVPAVRPPGPNVVTLAPPDVLTATVAVNGSDLSGVVVSPMKKVVISGRITFAGGSPTTLRGPMIRIAVIPKSPEAGMMPSQPAPAKDDFTFEVTAPAAEIGLRANVGNPEWVVKAIRVGTIDITDIGVDLRGTRELFDVEVELTNRPPEVTGVVTSSRGDALKEYTVLVFPQERERWHLDSRLVTLARPSMADGRYRVRTLPPGRYLAMAFESPQQLAFYQDPQLLESLRARATAFSIVDGQSLVLNLRVDGGR